MWFDRADEMLSVAKGFVLQMGRILKDRFGKVAVRQKAEKDLVTEMDVFVEEEAKRIFCRIYPDIGFLAEEKNDLLPEDKFFWAIDPIDGTNNYAHGYPVFCISVALMTKDNVVFGVVYDPMRDELFWSDKEAAYLNGERICVSSVDAISDALLCTGFAYRFREMNDTNVENFIAFLYSAQGVRRDGSAALDLCYVACGRFDGFWELGLKPWDTAAGISILEKAGGVFSTMKGEKFSPFIPEIVASNGKIHNEMLKILLEAKGGREENPHIP